MRDLIKHILKESTAKTNVLNLIKDEDIFVAAKFVGGMENLKKILKNDTEFTSLIDDLKGSLDLVYHSRKQFIEFPIKFEIVGKGVNRWDTNSWPIINLIYDDSIFSKSEKKIFNSFIFDTIGDLNIFNVDMSPKAKEMFRGNNGYYDIQFINGMPYETLENNVPYVDEDMMSLYKKYKLNRTLKESNMIKENEELGQDLKERFIRSAQKIAWILQSNVDTGLITNIETANINYIGRSNEIEGELLITSWCEDPDLFSFTDQLKIVDKEIGKVLINYTFSSNGSFGEKKGKNNNLMFWFIGCEWSARGDYSMNMKYQFVQDEYNDGE